MNARRRFEGCRAVVTGAGGGIGRAITIALATEGATVLATGRSAERLAETASLAAGSAVATYQCDLSDVKDVDRLGDQVARSAGGLDVLVCNAAVGFSAPFHETTLKNLQTTIDTNVRGTYLCLQMGIRLMLESGGGSAVVVGSLGGLRPAPRASAYGMSKAATHAMARHAALEYARNGIRVNAVAPGATDTALLGSADEDVRIQVADAVPNGKIATPEQVAKVVLFLASSESDHVTGQVWSIDGGSSVGAVV